MDIADGDLIVSTTAQIDDRPVREYLGIVTGEAMLRIAGGTQRGASPGRRLRSAQMSIAQRISDAREQAIAEMVRRARELGAMAIIAVNIDYTTIQRTRGDDFLVITASGSVVML